MSAKVTWSTENTEWKYLDYPAETLMLDYFSSLKHVSLVFP